MPSVGSWLRGGAPPRTASQVNRPQPERPAVADSAAAPWYLTLWLTGVDYFSSLGYAPAIAFLAAGYLAPFATLVLVLVTFFAAVPVYAFVAKHSFEGEGSIRMIERLTVGWGRLSWFGKTIVLVLIGFAMTDFVITITLSAADATHHVLENPMWPSGWTHNAVRLTAMMILLLGLVFLVGFREAISLAVLIAAPYMVLNAVVIGFGFWELSRHPEMFLGWWASVTHFEAADLHALLARIEPHSIGHDPSRLIGGTGPLVLVAMCLVVFPKLALGMSGFETGVSVMPLIQGQDREERIRNTRKMLLASASLMCVWLLGSSIVTSILIPADEFRSGGAASGRALAYLAHGLLGKTFGTIYDFNTVAILWFAGASAMAGLLNMIPRYLPRFGMSPTWIEYRRPLVMVLTGVCLLVNWFFSADVNAQGAAYATGVLVLMASGAFAVMLAEWENRRRRWAFLCMLLVFVYVLVVNVIERPDGIKIAGLFILATVIASLWSRWLRSSEIRVQGIVFHDPESEKLFAELKALQEVVVIPLRSVDSESRRKCEARGLLHLEVEKKTTPCFMHVELTEDPSQFSSPIRVRVSKEAGEYIIEVENAVAVANAIAYISLELGAAEVVIGLLDSGSAVVNAILYLLLGTGEVGYAVRSIFLRIRESRISEHVRRRRAFDAGRDRHEKEVIEQSMDLSVEQRSALVAQMFEQERNDFASVMDDKKQLPRLILVG